MQNKIIQHQQKGQVIKTTATNSSITNTQQPLNNLRSPQPGIENQGQSSYQNSKHNEAENRSIQNRMGQLKIKEELANLQEKLRKKSRDSQRIEIHSNLQQKREVQGDINNIMNNNGDRSMTKNINGNFVEGSFVIAQQEKTRMQQQSQLNKDSLIQGPQQQQITNNQILKNKNDTFTSKVQSDHKTPQSQLKINLQDVIQPQKQNKRESRSDTRLNLVHHQMLQQSQSQNSQVSNSTANTYNANNGGSDTQFKSKQLLEKKQVKLRQIMSNSPQLRIASNNLDPLNNDNDNSNNIPYNQQDQQINNQSNTKINSKYQSSGTSQGHCSGGEETPKSNRSRKNKRIIIDTAMNNSRGEIIIKETIQQHAEITSNPNTTAAAVTRKIPIDVQKKKKIIKVDSIQRLFKSNTTANLDNMNYATQPQQQIEIKKISRKSDAQHHLPNLNTKFSPLIQYESQNNVGMDKIDEESIQQFDRQEVEVGRKKSSKFLQKVSSNQSTGETNVKSNENLQHITETVKQLKLKRESKTLPQLHIPSSIAADLSPTNNLFSQTNPSNNNLQSQFISPNEEISYLKQELNLKNNQLSQLLKELRNKPGGANAIIASKESSQLIKIRKNPHHQSVLQQQQIQLKNQNRRGSGGESDSPQQVVIVDENQKTAVPALIKVKKNGKLRTQIEQSKRAMSQPELPPSSNTDTDRDDMQRVLRENKKIKIGHNNDQRGGGTAHVNLKNFQSNKEIFEYSPMVQNNYVDSQNSSPDKDGNDDTHEQQNKYGLTKNKSRQIKPIAKKILIKSDPSESDDLQQKIKGQKRNNESAKTEQQKQSDEIIQKVIANKGVGSSKLLKKPVKLPFLNNIQRNNDEQKESQEESKQVSNVQQNTVLKQNLIEKYQKYNQVYQKQVQTQLAQKQEQFRENNNKQSFSMKNLHQPISTKTLTDQESNNTETNFNTMQKSQSKDSLKYGKIKLNNNHVVNLAPIKMPSSSSTKSNLTKNMSVATLVLKKDQIRLNRDNNSSNNTNTFRNFGSIQASDIQAQFVSSQDIHKNNQQRFINDSIKPSTEDYRGSNSMIESNWNIMDQLQSKDIQQQQNSQFNQQLLDEDNPFLDRATINKNKQDQNQKQNQLQNPQQIQYQQPHMFQIPNPQLLMMYPQPPPTYTQQNNAPINFQNYPPQLQQQMLMDQHFQQMMFMNAAAMYQQLSNNLPQQTTFMQGQPMPPHIIAQKYPQLYQNNPQQQQQILTQNIGNNNHIQQPPNSKYTSPQKIHQIISSFQYSEQQQQQQQYSGRTQQSDQTNQNDQTNTNTFIQPLLNHEMMLQEQNKNISIIQNNTSMQQSQLLEQFQQPIIQQEVQPVFELNRKLLQQQQQQDDEEKDLNIALFSNINPYDKDDDELCNYEASDTPRDFFGKVLRESVPIVIIDDKEDDGIRSSTYSIKSRGPKDF